MNKPKIIFFDVDGTLLDFDKAEKIGIERVLTRFGVPATEENMQKYHILDCFECGSCSYNCPGRLPLTHTFKTAKLLFAARAAEEKARAEAAAKEAETK